MEKFQVIVILMCIAVILVGVAKKLQIPYPLALVLGGAVLGFIPQFGGIPFDPNMLLKVVLPPILYYGAFWMSIHEFETNWRAIFSLAFGLVIATTCVTGVLIKWLLPHCSWSLAFAFGAIVSPPDAAAATSVLKRFPLGSRLTTILEGESLVNDASALVLYRLAIIAILSGGFSVMEAGFEFTKIVTGGIAVGLLTGLILQTFSRFILQPIVAVVFSFTIPYLTYTIADSFGFSGVLAVVINGLIGARLVIEHASSARRVFGVATWDVIAILFNCFVFILLGSQLNAVTKSMTTDQMLTYSFYGLLVTLTMIVVRMVWVYLKHTIYYLRVRNDPKLREECKQMLSEDAILGWAGMRGIVSLTAALAIPITLPNGDILACRDDVIFIVFTVIMLTLLIPGLTLPMLIRWLNLRPTLDAHDAPQARVVLGGAVEEEVQSLIETKLLTEEEGGFLIEYFSARARVLDASYERDTVLPLELARRKILRKQRNIVIKLWCAGKIDDKLMSLLERELDLEEVQTARVEIS